MISVQLRSRDKIGIAVALGMLSLTAWLVTVYQAQSISMGGPDPSMSGTMRPSVSLLALLLFLSTWVVMMTAMMLPSAAPMIMTFVAVVQQTRARGRVHDSTALFVVGYVLAWGSSGLLAYAVSALLPVMGMAFPDLVAHAGLIGGAAIMVAGVYQLSPYKDLCLTQCRTPLGFIMTHWRGGRGGALCMGVQHGLYCIGCCWALMAIFFVVGLLNLAGMALLALLTFGEKVSPYGPGIAKVSGVLLLLSGLAIALHSVR